MLLTIAGFYSVKAAYSLVLNDSSSFCSPDFATSVYRDTTTSAKSFNEIVNSNSDILFSPIKGPIPNEGFSHAAFWFKTVIIDSSTTKRDWVFDVAMPSLHRVDFYITDGITLLDSLKSGFSVGKKAKRHSFRNPSIEIHSTPGAQYVIFSCIKSETPIVAPFFIREKQTYIEYDRMRDSMLSLYFGAALIIALYQFYMFFSIRDKGYLWLSLFIVFFILGQLTAVYGYLADWGVKNPGHFLRYLHIVNFLAASSGILLSRIFTNSATFSPKSNIVLLLLQTISTIFALISPYISFLQAEQVLLLLNIVPLPFIMYSAVVAFKKGHRPALYFLLATFSFITGIALYNMMYGFAIIPFNMFFYFIPNITFVITLSLYSVGLADKINTYRREHAIALEQAYKETNEKLQLQEEKNSIERELEQARKMELVGRLLSGFAHDIKNYINPILGYSQLIRKQCRTNKTLFSHTEQLIGATNQLKELSSTLMDITRKEQSGKSEIKLNNMIVQSGSIIKHSTQKSISVIIKNDYNNLTIFGNRGKIQNAVINIGLNAVDAIEEKGIVIIKTGVTFLDTKNAVQRKFSITEGAYAFISVEDTGIGMDQEVLDHLFEPYFTKKANGTGMGLINVYNCVMIHHGGIEITSKPGEGSTVTLYFPLHSENCNSGDSNDENKRLSDSYSATPFFTR